MPAFVTAISAQKGGVSKTTTSVNLAAALAIHGMRVLLCDLDPQANATAHLGIEPEEHAGRTMYELITKRCDAIDTIIENCREGLDLIPSHINLSAGAIEIVSMIAREQILAKQLSAVRDRYDYILIDCPPGTGLLTANAFAAADDVILTVQPEYFALKGLGLFHQLFEAVQAGCQPKLSIRGVLVCMVDPKVRGQMAIHRESEKSVREYYGDRVYETKIRQNVRLKEAPSFGKTIFEHALESGGAKDYLDLAEEILSHDKRKGRNEAEDRTRRESA